MIDLSKRSGLIALLMFVGINLLMFKTDLGGMPSYDDAYYAQKAKEMLQNGQWFVPHYNGAPSFDNPPGFIWLVAASYKIFGVNDFASVFPSALAGLLAILGTFFLFELLFGARVGFIAGMVLSLTTIFLKYSRHCMMDAEVALCTVWSLYALVRGLRGSSWWLTLAGVIASYVFFMKSAFGVLIPSIAFVYLVSTRQWRPFLTPAFWLGVVLMCVPYGYWCFHEYQLYGQAFLHSHFYDLLFRHATDRSDSDRVYDYVVVMLKYFPIWLPFMALGAWRAIRAKPLARKEYWLPVAYFTMYFLILSVQGTTKTWYFLPAFPACAGLAALGLDSVLKRYTLPKIARVYGYLGVGIFLLFHLTNISLAKVRERDIRLLAPYVKAAGVQQFKIFALDADFFGINNALLYYGDTAATPVKTADLGATISGAAKLAILVPTDRWAEISKSHPQLVESKNSGEMILATTAPIDTRTVFGRE